MKYILIFETLDYKGNIVNVVKTCEDDFTHRSENILEDVICSGGFSKDSLKRPYDSEYYFLSSIFKYQQKSGIFGDVDSPVLIVGEHDPNLDVQFVVCDKANDIHVKWVDTDKDLAKAYLERKAVER